MAESLDVTVNLGLIFKVKSLFSTVNFQLGEKSPALAATNVCFVRSFGERGMPERFR